MGAPTKVKINVTINYNLSKYLLSLPLEGKGDRLRWMRWMFCTKAALSTPHQSPAVTASPQGEAELTSR